MSYELLKTPHSCTDAINRVSTPNSSTVRKLLRTE